MSVCLSVYHLHTLPHLTLSHITSTPYHITHITYHTTQTSCWNFSIGIPLVASAFVRRVLSGMRGYQRVLLCVASDHITSLHTFTSHYLTAISQYRISLSHLNTSSPSCCASFPWGNPCSGTFCSFTLLPFRSFRVDSHLFISPSSCTSRHTDRQTIKYYKYENTKLSL